MAEAWPSALIPSDMRWGIETNTLGLESPWTRSGQFYRMQGARWVCQVTFRNLDDARARNLQGFLDHLAGPIRVVALPVWIQGELRGNAAGTILATGAAHSINVSLTGITGPNPAFQRGDLISIGGRLHRITAGGAHTAGTAAVSVAPPLREAASNTAVVVSDMTCPMRLVGDDEVMGRFRPKPFGDFNLSFVEALP